MAKNSTTAVEAGGPVTLLVSIEGRTNIQQSYQKALPCMTLMDQ